MSINKKIITWEQFAICNTDKRASFENMCRILFKKTIVNDAIIEHSNPNNPGVEIEPVLINETNKKVSFQSKYFDSLTSNSYEKIKESAETAIKYYKGNLDTIYLYCNFDLTTSAKTYLNTINLLKKNNIELIPVTGQTILNQIMETPVISSYFFLAHKIDDSWFSKNVNESIRNLGGRYNKFNINTIENTFIDLFLHNNNAANLINHKKDEAIKELKYYRGKYPEHQPFLDRLYLYIKNIENVTSSSLSDSFNWSTKIKHEFAKELANINTKIQHIESEFENITINEYEKKLDKEREINKLLTISELSDLLDINNLERNAINNKMIIVRGEAGTGKSQLFAVSAKKELENDSKAVLLLGQKFINNNYLESQLQSNLNIDYSIEEYIQILDCIGEKNNSQVVLFIDAINESSYRKIWKNGLINLYNFINNTSYVRLAISIRSGYERFVLDENINSLINEQKITSITHSGFEVNSIQAIKEFLDFFSIPFYPTYMLDSKFTNPLFLNLFCKLYKGSHKDNDFNIFELFELLVTKTNNELLSKNSIETEDNLVKNFIYTLVNKQIDNGYKRLSKTEILNLSFWDTYGLIKKLDSLSIMERAGVLYSFTLDEEEFYGIGYNLLEDYYSAKRIIELYNGKGETRKYLKEELLSIEDGKVKKHGNNNIFVAACNLYAEKYGEECIDIIENSNESLKTMRWYNPYIRSYSLRDPKGINLNYFICFCNKHHLTPETVFSVLFENCIKKEHPLNADFLHSILINKKLNDRDNIWTMYINTLDYDNRINQIVDYINKGGSFSDLETESLLYLLTLLSWLLTSSNRHLRDNTSKAIVELLRKHFSLCLPLLQKFESVNDPYVLQRLYGSVFGACSKRSEENKDEYLKLVKYIYSIVFQKEKVYPDILFRDYARLIIERFLYEFPHLLNINLSIINPPYHSDDIPKVKKEKYYDDKEVSGMSLISYSMFPNTKNTPGLYGDFGRYIFQSTIEQFENVDIDNLFHFAMQYIRDELGYKNDYFSEFDRHYRCREIRSTTKKAERIGKKYQWIAFFNILARLSDRKRIVNFNDEKVDYLGPWQLYIRDFDPTSNHNHLISENAPSIPFIGSKSEFISFDSDKNTAKKWTEEKGSFFSQLPPSLIAKDKNGVEWIRLYAHDNVEISQDFDYIFAHRGERIWAITEAYFVKEKDYDALVSHLSNTNLSYKKLPVTYTPDDMYLREYPWATTYLSSRGDNWSSYEANTGEEIDVPSTSFEMIESPNGEIEFKEKECTKTEKVKEKIADILSSYNIISWNSQYDASIEEAIVIYVPCDSLINYFELKIKEYEGYYYFNDDLVACEVKNESSSNALLFRKDYLDKYLTDNHYKLFWTSYGEKQFFYVSPDQEYKQWCGVLSYNNNNIQGNIDLSDNKTIDD